jgi:hypothetical protein
MGEMNLMKRIARRSADARRKIGRKGCPSAEVGRSLLEELGRAGRARQLSHRCRSEIALDGV